MTPAEPLVGQSEKYIKRQPWAAIGALQSKAIKQMEWGPQLFSISFQTRGDSMQTLAEVTLEGTSERLSPGETYTIDRAI